MHDIATGETDFRGHKQQIFYRRHTVDENIIHDIFVDHAYDLARLARGAEINAYAERIGAGGKRPLVIDAGAHIGMASLYYLLMLGRPRVVAVESSPENFGLLEKNAAGHNVRCLHAAISATRGLAEAVDPQMPGGSVAHRAIPAGEGTAVVGRRLGMVPRVTVDDLYDEEMATAFPFIVKVDIEGGEADLFSANTGWIARTPVLVVEVHDWLLPGQGVSAPFLKAIASLDRDFVVVGENIYSIANHLD